MAKAQDFDINTGGIRLRVEGLTKTVRALEAAGTASEEMRDLMHKLGMIVVSEARGRVPAESGSLRASIRAGRGKTKAVVRAGSRAVPYAGVIHHGWYAHGIEAAPFLKDALIAKRSSVFNELDQGIGDLLTKAGL